MLAQWVCGVLKASLTTISGIIGGTLRGQDDSLPWALCCIQIDTGMTELKGAMTGNFMQIRLIVIGSRSVS